METFNRNIFTTHTLSLDGCQQFPNQSVCPGKSNLPKQRLAHVSNNSYLIIAKEKSNFLDCKDMNKYQKKRKVLNLI